MTTSTVPDAPRPDRLIDVSSGLPWKKFEIGAEARSNAHCDGDALSGGDERRRRERGQQRHRQQKSTTACSTASDENGEEYSQHMDCSFWKPRTFLKLEPCMSKCQLKGSSNYKSLYHEGELPDDAGESKCACGDAKTCATHRESVSANAHYLGCAPLTLPTLLLVSETLLLEPKLITVPE